MKSCIKLNNNCSGVYKISSKAKPHRYYIGSSVCIRRRWAGHLHDLRQNKHHSPKLQHHYNKYGEGDLEFTVIETCDRCNLIVQEQFFIDTYNPWFNVLPNAFSCLGMKHSDEAKAKISESNRRRSVSEETKNKIRDAHIGKRLADETKIKMSAIRKGRKFSDEHKAKISESLSGRRVSEETREKLKMARKNRVITEETKRRLSESHKGERNYFYGKKHSEKTKEKLRDAWHNATPERRGRMKEIRKLVRPYSEDRRARMAEITRGKMESEERRKAQSEIAMLVNHRRWHGDNPIEECLICSKKRSRKKAIVAGE